MKFYRVYEFDKVFLISIVIPFPLSAIVDSSNKFALLRRKPTKVTAAKTCTPTFDAEWWAVMNPLTPPTSQLFATWRRDSSAEEGEAKVSGHRMPARTMRYLFCVTVVSILWQSRKRVGRIG